MEALSARQLLALSYRAEQRGDAGTQFGDGVTFQAGWLAAAMRAHQDDTKTLQIVLRAKVRDGLNWDRTDFQDGCAAVLDDVAAILDNDPHIIRAIIDQGRAKARATKEA